MLSDNQQKAVQCTNGRLLILAGAGSGKTRVIVHRIAYLIRDKGVSPQAILGLTFTNKAAEEMRERAQLLIGMKDARLLTLCTFHSFCMQVLRKEIGKLGYTRNFSLYDERDLNRVIGQLTREMTGHQGSLPSLAPTRLSLNDAASGKKQFPSSTQPNIWHDKFSKELHDLLQSTLRAHNAVSFDHLISLTIRLFEEYPAVLESYQERFRYLMIDEYQDANPSQFHLAELLAAKYNNLCVVGDDDQSIYGWRGAEVSHILHFKADRTIKLEQNYRSASFILDTANAVIAHNKNRHDKKLWSAEQSDGLIEIFHAPTDLEEALSIVQRILGFKEKGFKWRDMAILYRSNALSRQFERALIQASWQKEGRWMRGIPYEIFGGLEFSERSEIKDIMSFLRIIANEKDEEALLRIINIPRRGISDLFLDHLTQINRTEKIPLWQVLTETASSQRGFPSFPRGVNGIRAFVVSIEAARKRFHAHALADSLSWFLEEIQYKKAIAEEVKSEKMRLFKWENVQECVNALAQYEQESQEPSIMDFIANTTLGKPVFPSAMKGSHGDMVQLMTLHSAKGLEFPVCFIVGLEDHILPHEKSVAATGIEEERRLFYVGITRAKKWLTLSMARSRMRMGQPHPTTPSRFLFEIPKHLVKATSYKNYDNSHYSPPP
ncbi:MAG TPA: UvrD-helicase domain-containing protein [Chlamydiales bacterium]|nr:UvrD-helicase domain-containing protein [Chlamydiales bacterium]